MARRNKYLFMKEIYTTTAQSDVVGNAGKRKRACLRKRR